MLANFDASVKEAKQADDYDILLSSDKISEGFNLNRAGLIVDYDIPWNPTEEISIEKAIELIRCEFDTPRIPFSEAFWEDYAAVRDFRKKHSAKPKQNSIEAMALNAVNAYLREQSMAPLHSFLKTLREDMTEYKTLPSNTLRRIAEIGSNPDKVLKGIARLKAELGSDYLQQLKNRIGALNEEVIIAVENQTDKSKLNDC